MYAEHTPLVVRRNRSDDPSPYRSDHWWVETPDGYVIKGPYHSFSDALFALGCTVAQGMAA